MRLEAFIKRLLSGKVCSFTYITEGLEGGVEVHRHEDVFVLTWEEFPIGGFFDESRYTRDEVHRFASIDEVLAFLGSAGLDVTRFHP